MDYRGKLVLAPMVRSGECPSRLLALKYGADLVWGPETVDKSMIGTTRRENAVTKTVDFTRHSSNGTKNAALDTDQRESIIYRLHPEKEGRKHIFQIGTSNAETAVQAAKLIAPDVAGIDVNAGCPKPFSTSGGMGAALLKTPETLCAILQSLVSEVGVPNEIGISVKIRILETTEETAALVRRLVATGITGLTVHCRTTPMRPRERAIRDQLRMVASICRDAGVACVMNGDVMSREEAIGLISEYGCDGAMIATAAETNPSVFRTQVEGGKAPWEEVVEEYVKTSIEVENRWGNTKYLLNQMIPGRHDAHRAMTRTKSYVQLIKALKYDDDFLKLARDVDKTLEIGEHEKPKMTTAARKAASKDKTFSRPTLEGFKQATAGVKRTADMAQLDMPLDVAREAGPGSVQESASILAT